jgi:Domain of unknown function (DUF1998)
MAETKTPEDPEGAATEADVDATVVEAPPEEGEELGQSPHRVAENLLDRLLYKGVLPRYAFPTDVVSFYVFDRANSTRFRPEYLYAPSQGLPIALSQYAPGKEIWIDGKLWTSGALYSPMSEERFQAWQDRRLYLECTLCRYARTFEQGEVDRGEVRDCPACGSEESFGPAHNWIRPPGFAHPVSIEEGTSLDDQPVRSYATRAKLVASGPADPESWHPLTTSIRQDFARRPLLVTNTGPRQEGYTYCFKCGLIEPTANPSRSVTGPHQKPFPDERDQSCSLGASTRGLVLGTDFISDVLLISLTVDRPLTLRPEFLATHVALRTISEALTAAATKNLELEPGEVQAEYRPALSAAGHEGLEAEIYVYDTLAGGAGFSRRMGELGLAVFEEATSLLEECPAGCDHSCYRCLRSFKNRFEHQLLDRHLGASLLRYLVHAVPLTLDPGRLEQATDRLYEDLERHGLEGVELVRDALVDVAGIGEVHAPILARKHGDELIVGVHAPLTPDHPATEDLFQAKEFGTTPVQLIDEIMVSLNLPAASRRVIQVLQ